MGLRPRVLVARLDSAGDVLLSGPAVRAVAAAADVVYLCSRRGEPAARLLPGVAAVEVFDAPWVLAPAPPVRRDEFDALVDRLAGLGVAAGCILTSSHQSPLPLALAARLAGIAPLAGISVDYAGALLDQRIPGDPDVHEVERALSIAGALGFALPPGDDGRLAVRTVPSPPDEVAALGRYAVVHPGSAAPARTWQPARWRTLVGALAAEGWPVVVTGAASERALGAEVAGGRSGVLDRSGAGDLAELAAVLSGAAVVVSGNTGPMHLAAAVGTPVVALFAPTVPASRWRPWHVPHALLGDQEISCRGCRSLRCPHPTQWCLEEVTVTEAVQACLRLAEATGLLAPIRRVDA